MKTDQNIPMVSQKKKKKNAVLYFAKKGTDS